MVQPFRYELRAMGVAIERRTTSAVTTSAHELLVKPRYRGRVHELACAVAVPAGAFLIVDAHHAAGYVAAAVFATSIIALFGTSAAYHRRSWTESWRSRMQQLDHTMIFVLIAGSYTPLALVALHGAVGIALLTLAWACATIGIAATFIRYDVVDRYEAVLYTAFGWIVLPAIPAVVSALSTAELAFLGAGGAIYTVGAIGFAHERPDPWPRTFGYHEIWHVMTVIAAACHFVLVFDLVRS
jgi:hemolysin III